MMVPYGANRAVVSRFLAALTSLAVALTAIVVFRAPAPALNAAFIAIAMTAGGCGLIGALLLPHGSGGAYRALWAALGLLLALALPTLMSVGIVYLVATAMIGFALATMPSTTGQPWWHPRYLWLGLLAFTVALWTLYLLSRTGPSIRYI